ASELRDRVHNILEVRLLHLELKQTIRALEESREVIRLKNLAEKEKMEQELAQAEETQRSLLPAGLPAFENYRIRAYNSPTRYVGGDFYDFLPLESGAWWGVLADVSGKGIPAALLSSMVLGALRMAFHAGTGPAEVVRRVNELLCEKSLEWQFVTLFLFVLDPQGTGQFISAGHNLSVVFRAETGDLEELKGNDYFLGMFGFATYTARPLQLREGDIMLVYSDGLTDARNENDEMFGNKTVLRILRESAAAGGAVLERALLDAIERFTGATPRADDITFLIIEKSGS
ncbi:MAG: PP2C family protein-serine/threonine phosphatase, partial [Acidobacteriota bacterium]